MRTRKEDIERRTVIEAYARYDCPKKGLPTPDFAAWDWSEADSIDRAMKSAHLKIGVPAGYLLWDEVEITMSDLLESAVDVGIFPGQRRMLGFIKPDQLARCRPGQWHGWITQGRTFDEDAPMLLRPAVSGESPASWYIEDGSGRAITFVANQHLFDPSQTLAIGFLGRKPDPRSLFMQQNYRELL